MEKSKTIRNEVWFDDKDIITDGDLWEWFLDSGIYIPYAYSENSLSALFFIGNNPYLATIPKAQCNNILVKSLGKDIGKSDYDTISFCFMQCNKEEDSDIFVERYSLGSKEISFRFYHTEE